MTSAIATATITVPSGSRRVVVQPPEDGAAVGAPGAHTSFAQCVPSAHPDAQRAAHT